MKKQRRSKKERTPLGTRPPTKALNLIKINQSQQVLPTYSQIQQMEKDEDGIQPESKSEADGNEEADTQNEVKNSVAALLQQEDENKLETL